MIYGKKIIKEYSRIFLNLNLGLIRKYVEDYDFKTIILIEILARVIKNNLRLKLRLKMQMLKKPLEEPYR